MKYKSIHRLNCSLADYNARGIMGVVREELENDTTGWEIINIETVYNTQRLGYLQDYWFVIWIGELI